MTGRLVDISFSLNRKQRITLEVDSDFRNLWDKLNQEPLLDIEIKKHRNKRSRSANRSKFFSSHISSVCLIWKL